MKFRPGRLLSAIGRRKTEGTASQPSSEVESIGHSLRREFGERHSPDEAFPEAEVRFLNRSEQRSYRVGELYHAGMPWDEAVQQALREIPVPRIPDEQAEVASREPSAENVDGRDYSEIIVRTLHPTERVLRRRRELEAEGVEAEAAKRQAIMEVDPDYFVRHPDKL